ncbi:hypothetical protein [Nostocoides australiense]
MKRAASCGVAVVVAVSACGGQSSPQPPPATGASAVTTSGASSSPRPSVSRTTPPPETRLEEECGLGAKGPIEGVRSDAESEIRYGRIGSGSTVAIFLHQSPGSMCGWMDYVGLATKQAEFTALTVNSCGKGDTRCSKALSDNPVGFLTPIVEHARTELGADRVVVVGASAGGAVALAGGQQAGADAIVDLSGPAYWRGYTEAEPAAAATTVPLLIVCSDSDFQMKPERLRAAVQGSPAKVKKYLDPPEGGHGWDIVTEEPGDTVKLTKTGRLVLDWITGDYPASG